MNSLRKLTDLDMKRLEKLPTSVIRETLDHFKHAMQVAINTDFNSYEGASIETIAYNCNKLSILLFSKESTK